MNAQTKHTPEAAKLAEFISEIEEAHDLSLDGKHSEARAIMRFTLEKLYAIAKAVTP